MAYSFAVRVYDTGNRIVKGVEQPYVVTEFVPGWSLRSIMKEQGPLDLRRALEISIRICKAVEVLHESGLTGFDVRPERVLLSPDGSIRLLGLGVGTVDGLPADSSLARYRSGSEYLPPELWERGIRDARRDTYSIELMLAKMLIDNNHHDGGITSAFAEGVGGLKEIPYSATRGVKGLTKIIAKATELGPGGHIKNVRDLRVELSTLFNAYARRTYESPIDCPQMMCITSPSVVQMRSLADMTRRRRMNS